jgi:uncharacterized protein
MLATLFTSTFAYRNTPTASAEIGIPSLPYTYTQNFDTLASSGTTNSWTDDTTILGWYASRTVYAGSNGSSNSGTLYSFGTTAADRALGSINTNATGAISTGLRLKNNSATTITTLVITYTGEQWRNNGNASAQKLDFSYQIGATVTSLSSGSWTDVNELDFVSLVNTATAAQLDGNAAANRTTLSASISVNIPSGQEVMLRWADPNESGNDHGLAIDDVAVTAQVGTVVVDTAPTVTATTPASNATDVAINSNITITFSEPVTVTGQLASLVCDSNPVAVTVTGGPTTYTVDPTADLGNGQNCTVTVNAASVTDQDGTPTQMAANYVFSFTTVALAGACPTPTTTLVSIPALQGTTDTNTANGQNRTVRGVVVADYQGSTGLFGFNIQDPAGDANPLTSDGVFVFVPAANTAWINFDVAVGDSVQVSGRATEFSGLTEIDTVTSIVKCGTDQVLAPTVIDLPEAVNNDLERFEGMLVSIPETLTVDQNFFQGRYGQVTLSSDGRLYNPTNNNIPGSAGAIAQAELNARRLIVLDDAFSGQNPAPIPFIGLNNTLRAGDTVAGITGTLDFGPINSDTTIRDYRVQPTVAPVITRVNQRTAAPEAVGGNVKVASFNVLNYFTTIDQTGAQCFPGGTRTDCRGADSAAEFDRQRTKIITAMLAINADVFGLMEIENNGNTAVGNLVAGLNAVAGANTYAVVTNPAGDTDAIKVAMIYKPAKVTPVGAPLGDLNPIHNRVPLAQTFSLNSNGQKFSVIVNHFKSKGSCPASGLDADQGDGQGCWNATRVQQAQALLTFVNTVKTQANDNDVLIIGDLNSYGKENPITTLTSNGFVNEIEKLIGSTAYSYVFDGFAGYLDHALASTSLDPQVSGVTEWHINADEPSVIDYNTEFKPQDLYTPTPYRSSDHDPVVIGLQLGGNLTPASFAGSSKTVNTATVQAGGLLTYTLTISNSGQTASTYMLTDTLNANLTFVSASPAMTQVGQQLTASGSVGPNSQQQYVITVRVNAGFSGVVNNSATLSGDGQTRTLTAPPVTVTAAPTAANFSTSQKTVNASTVQAGGLLTYTLNVINSGQLPATYMLTDTLNANLIFVSATPSMTRNGQQLSASGIVNGGSTATYIIVVRVSDSFSGALNNSATLSGDGQTRTLTAPVVTVQVGLRKLYLPFITN